jgi:hypothetical protein
MDAAKNVILREAKNLVLYQRCEGPRSFHLLLIVILSRQGCRREGIVILSEAKDLDLCIRSLSAKTKTETLRLHQG